MNNLTEEQDNLLCDTFPIIYRGRNSPETSIWFGFDIGAGWFDLIWELSSKLEKIAESQLEKQLLVVQVKQKFGGLRFYIDNGTYEALDFINQAEAKSFTICEECGEPGEECEPKRWIYTLCEKHKAEYEKAP